MKDIKFRAWTGKEMLKDVIPINESAVITDMQGFPEQAFVLYRHDIKDIMQFSGFKDKKNIDIYEGDVYIQGDYNIKYKVIFKDGVFVGNQIGNKSLAGIAHFIKHIEVIGNIYENPNFI